MIAFWCTCPSINHFSWQIHLGFHIWNCKQKVELRCIYLSKYRLSLWIKFVVPGGKTLRIDPLDEPLRWKLDGGVGVSISELGFPNCKKKKNSKIISTYIYYRLKDQKIIFGWAKIILYYIHISDMNMYF